MPAKTANDPIDDLRSAARGISESAEAELTELRAKVEALMEKRVAPMVTQVADDAREAAHNAADAVRRNADSMLDEVRARPLTSLGVAVAAGFLLAQLLRR